MRSKEGAVFDNDKFNPYIHGSRGLFSLSVFLFHVTQSGLKGPDLPDLLVQAQKSLAFGVDLFFIISGIVIFGAYKRATSVPLFLWDRVTRIFPVLWVTVLFIFILGSAAGMKFGSDMVADRVFILIGNLLALPPIVPIPLIHPAAWSLSYEFAFYIAFSVFGFLCIFLNRNISMLLVILIFIAVFWHHVRAIFFVSGLLIAAGMLDQPRLRPLLRFPLLWLLVFLAAWQGMAMLAEGNVHAAIWSRVVTEPELLGLLIVSFSAATLAMAGIASAQGTAVLLGTKTMQWLGSISFSFYLWHGPIMALVKRFMYVSGVAEQSGSYAQLVFLVLSLLPTLVVSELSRRYLETQATRWLRSGWKFDRSDRISDEASNPNHGRK